MLGWVVLGVALLVNVFAGLVAYSNWRRSVPSAWTRRGTDAPSVA